jgi:hypothetical protein
MPSRTDRAGPTVATAPRRMHCASCGAAFECGLGGTCWCADLPVRVPMPAAGVDCLCPACLLTAGKQAAQELPG